MTHAHALPLPGSRRHALAEARRVSDAPPAETVLVTVVLRRAGADGHASQDDVDAIWQFASDAGLEVAGVSRPARSVRLRGDVASMSAAFAVTLGTYEASGLTFRGREGSVYVPAALDGAVIAVLGLDSRPAARAHFRYAPGYAPAGAVTPAAIVAPRARANGMSPQQVAAAYDFPTDVDGSGQTIAVIELGGGYRVDDLQTYFAAQGLKMPVVEAIGVDGANNAPGDDADGEVMLDIEVIGAIAQGATIAVYFGPNTTNGFYDAIAAAIHDTARRPSAISISWGQAESGWTASALDAYDALFADAAAAGITVYAAAGDNGASDGADDGGLHVDFPASSPSVVGCGGTRLESTEVVWNELASDEGATGGGFSAHFEVPPYQLGLPALHGRNGRGVPDVAGNADPLTGYLIRVDGQDSVIGGTSAVAPLWAALTALICQRLGVTLGAPHAALYASPSAFRDVVGGDNGGFSAGAGWDACTGLGTPDGQGVAAALSTPEPAA